MSIKPKAGSPSGCTCKKVELTGQYSAQVLIKCEKCLDVYKSKDKNSCPSGTKIFSPRTRADWKTFLASATPLRNPHWIIDVTRPQNGCGGCTGHVMNSGVAAQATWVTSDGSPWWLRSTSYSQPNGDYLANCYLDLWHAPANENSVTFDDGNCNFHARSYYCQSLKTTTTTTTTPKAQYFGGSKLLTASNQARLFAWGVPNGDWKLCYRKTTHGASGDTYHSRCDGKGGLVTVMKLSTGKTIGGYLSKSMHSLGRYIPDGTNSFLFSLTNNFKHSASQAVWRNYPYGGYGRRLYGPAFGGGHDLVVHGIGMNGGYCNIGYSYSCRIGSRTQSSCRNDFCGSYNSWKVSELEVYYK